MKDIKIFVSHRIDMDAETIDNPLFVNVRCGAVQDRRKNVTMLGDNTGDNISEKRMTFSEMTVQYWAWKNWEADYYGLCHYRRYMSFADERYEYPIEMSEAGTSGQCIISSSLDQKAVEKFNLLEGEMRSQIESCDMMIVEPMDIKKYYGNDTVQQHMQRSKSSFFVKDFEMLNKIIYEKHRDYYDDACYVFHSGGSWRWYNCYIMKKELWDTYNSWLFDILFEFENCLDVTSHNESYQRTPARASELLFSIFVYHVQKMKQYKIKTQQLIFFDNTTKVNKGNADIKIFVSHRIDQNSTTIDNSLFVDMRCGAVQDRRKNVTMLGDDTGDNISEKRLTFNGMTVQYWAWKNVHADYYGFFQYHRYLSFAEERFPEGKGGFILDRYISSETVGKYALSEGAMRSLIEQYDLITNPPIDTRIESGCASVYEAIKKKPHTHNISDVDALIDIVKEKHPAMAVDVDEYFTGHFLKYYNCNIMKREIFIHYSEWLFDILFELEKRIDMTHYNSHKKRIIAFMSEMLFGIYYINLKRTKQFSIKELQIVEFEKPEKRLELRPFRAERNVPIILMSSNFYVPYCAVAIKSIMETASPEWNYDIIVLQSHISPENKLFLSNMSEDMDNISIRFYDPESRLQGVVLHKGGANCVESYYRMLVPYILEHYNRAIAMDCDLVVMEDISRLLVEDLHGFAIGATRDATWNGWMNSGYNGYRDYALNELELKDVYGYVNTGVLLWDLELFRAQFSLEQVLECAQAHRYRIQEQDALNVLLQGRICTLSLSWNVYTYSHNNVRQQINDWASDDLLEEYLQARSAPKIIHYAGIIKPWSPNGPESDMALFFWDIARRSPFYETIIKRMCTDIAKVSARDISKREINAHAAASHESQTKNPIHENQARNPFKKAVLPIFKIFFPYGSKRYVTVKAMYFKLRGWPYNPKRDLKVI